MACSLYTSDTCEHEIAPVSVAVGYNSTDNETTRMIDGNDIEQFSFDPYGKNIASSFKHDGGEEGGNTHPHSSQYWGRFDDPVADSVAVLPSGLAMDDGTPIATAELDDRKARHLFIRKVYLILIAQLFVTFSTCAVMTLHEPTRDFVLGEGQPLYTVCNVLMLVTICALSWYKRSYPKNIILLSFFTLSCSYTVGTVTAMYAQAGAGDLVLEAVLITAIVFVILTFYTLQSKQDFSFLQAGLGAGLWIMILWGFSAIIFGLETGWVYAMGGSVLFSGFIIYDTFMLAERHDPQDYVIAAVELYLDIINLFMYILSWISRD